MRRWKYRLHRDDLLRAKFEPSPLRRKNISMMCTSSENSLRRFRRLERDVLIDSGICFYLTERWLAVSLGEGNEDNKRTIVQYIVPIQTFFHQNSNISILDWVLDLEKDKIYRGKWRHFWRKFCHLEIFPRCLGFFRHSLCDLTHGFVFCFDAVCSAVVVCGVEEEVEVSEKAIWFYGYVTHKKSRIRALKMKQQ